MSKQQEALRLALEALEYNGLLKRKQAITAIREALAEQPAQGCEFCSHPLYAGTKCKNCGREQPVIKQDLTPEQPAQQEPFAYAYTGIKHNGEHHGPHLVWKPAYMDAMSASMGAVAVPLYTSPPASKPWVGLTDEEIEQVCVPLGAAMLSFTEVAQAIEAKLREKNA